MNLHEIDLISRAAVLALPHRLSPSLDAADGYYVSVDAIRALPAEQVQVKPLEWVPKDTFSDKSIRFDAKSLLGRFSIEYGAWTNGKLILVLPWQTESIWLENDPDAAKAYAYEQLSTRILGAMKGGEA